MLVTVSQQEIGDKGLSNVIPARVKKSARLTVNCLQDNTDDDVKWTRAACLPNSDAEKKTILALVLAAQVDFVMGNHVYKVGDTIYLQTDAQHGPKPKLGGVHGPGAGGLQAENGAGRVRRGLPTRCSEEGYLHV